MKKLVSRITLVFSLLFLITACIPSKVYAESTVSLKKGSWKEQVYSYKEGNKDVWYKIKVTKPGNVCVTLKATTDDYVSTEIQLYDSKKEEIGKAVSCSVKADGTGYQNPLYFGVKKGTYYIKIHSYHSYKVKYDFTAKKIATGTSKETAIPIKLDGGAKTGICLATSAKEDAYWYTFTLDQDSKFTLSMEGKCSGYIDCLMTGDNIYDTQIYINDVRTSDSVSSRNTLRAGTYYLQVFKQRDDMLGGLYSIKITSGQ